MNSEFCINDIQYDVQIVMNLAFSHVYSVPGIELNYEYYYCLHISTFKSIDI